MFSPKPPLAGHGTSRRRSEARLRKRFAGAGVCDLAVVRAGEAGHAERNARALGPDLDSESPPKNEHVQTAPPKCAMNSKTSQKVHPKNEHIQSAPKCAMKGSGLPVKAQPRYSWGHFKGNARGSQRKSSRSQRGCNAGGRASGALKSRNAGWAVAEGLEALRTGGFLVWFW